MISKSELGERRKHQRFQVQNRVFVGVGPHFDKVGRIIDVSLGGLAFRYVARGEPPDGLSLDIFSADVGFFLRCVPFETVADFEIPNEKPFDLITTRQCAVQFGNLTPHQMSQLEYFIQNYTNGGVLIYHSRAKQNITEGKMRFQEIRRIAKDMGIGTYRMNKTDVIRAIQKEENNIECYGTERVEICQEEACLWKSDCLLLNNK